LSPEVQRLWSDCFEFQFLVLISWFLVSSFWFWDISIWFYGGGEVYIFGFLVMVSVYDILAFTSFWEVDKGVYINMVMYLWFLLHCLAFWGVGSVFVLCSYAFELKRVDEMMNRRRVHEEE
jgi:hypothetical protein